MMTLMMWLLVKHFVVDFLLQRPYQYLNKGIYGHWGGILHATLHCVSTYIILMACGAPPSVSFWLAFFDGWSHYHIDWAKVQITEVFALTPMNSEKYWWLLGFDQFLHQMVYVLIVLLAL